MNKDLTVGRPESVLIRFALPLFGSVIFQQMYNIADSFVAGHYAGEKALAAVGNSYEITLIYLAFAFGCNMGCSIVAARLFGAKKYGELKSAVSTTVIFTTVLVAVLTAAGFLGSEALMRLMKTPEEIFADSRLYLYIYTGGLVFLFFYNIATGLFSALGDSRTPFLFLAVSSVSNVILDVIFVKEFGMGVAGVAWATFICQGISCVISVAVIARRLIRLPAGGHFVWFSAGLFQDIITVAVPSMLQQSFVSVGNIIIQSLINSFGASVIAGYSAAIKLNNLVITSITAMGNAMSNFTAQNIGAGKKERIRQGYRGGLLFAYGMCLPITLLYLLAGKTLIGLFMDGNASAAVEEGCLFLKIVAPFYVLVATKLISDGILRGLIEMKKFMAATFTDLVLRVVLAIIFSGIWGSLGIWLSWPVGWFFGTALSLVFALGILRRFKGNSHVYKSALFISGGKGVRKWQITGKL